MKKTISLLALLLLLPMSAHAWWNADWKVRKKVTLDTSAVSAPAGESINSVPVAVRLHTGNFLFSDAKPDGSDLRFVAGDDKTPLKHHIESFDAANQLAIVWVQVPRVVAKAPTAEFFWMYSANPAAVGAEDAKGVYAPAARLRLNFGEPDGAFKDASAYANAVAAAGVSYSAAGVAGGAAHFEGKPLQVSMVESARIVAGAASGTTAVTPAAGMSWSAWVKPGAAGTGQLFSWSGLSFEMAPGGKLVAALDKLRVEAPGVQPDAWQHVSLSLSDRLVVYLNGLEVAAQPATLRELAGTMALGQGFTGDMDAVEVTGSAQPALWFQAQAAQGPDARLLAYGEGEQDGAAAEDHGGYLSVLVNSLTLDAKVVIVILAIMFAIAVYVMVSKAVLVGRIDRHNAAFLGRFEQDPAAYLDPSAPTSMSLREGGATHDSSLVRLYSTGMRELSRRMAPGSKSSQTSLSAEAVASIKASIDSTLIRETQRLNSLMVLLTIAISGGPFLGLLGTVVGVMITFAAIAASGDVNINAIAPGIAAALLATVAGLTVAIPALFGYNYLLTRIKNITADMQAFSDEFITRMAEAHNA